MVYAVIKLFDTENFQALADKKKSFILLLPNSSP